MLDLATLPFLFEPIGGGAGGNVSCFAPISLRTSCSSSNSACSSDIDGDLVFERGLAASNGASIVTAPCVFLSVCRSAGGCIRTVTQEKVVPCDERGRCSLVIHGAQGANISISARCLHDYACISKLLEQHAKSES